MAALPTRDLGYGNHNKNCSFGSSYFYFRMTCLPVIAESQRKASRGGKEMGRSSVVRKDQLNVKLLPLEDLHRCHAHQPRSNAAVANILSKNTKLMKYGEHRWI